MKVIATILLGLGLCPSVRGKEYNMHAIQEGCKARNTPRDSSYEVGLVDGYISGYAEATPLRHRPPTVGELQDAVCKYVDLHPELWSMPRDRGLDLVLNALYGAAK